MKGIKEILSLSVGDYGGAIIVSAFWFLLAFLISDEIKKNSQYSKNIIQAAS